MSVEEREYQIKPITGGLKPLFLFLPLLSRPSHVENRVQREEKNNGCQITVFVNY